MFSSSLTGFQWVVNVEYLYFRSIVAGLDLSKERIIDMGEMLSYMCNGKGLFLAFFMPSIDSVSSSSKDTFP